MWAPLLRLVRQIGVHSVASPPRGPRSELDTREPGAATARSDVRRGPAPGADPSVLRVLCHEFRTPIVSVKALAGALDGGLALADDDRQEVARLIAGHAQHLTDMLEAVRVVADTLDAPRSSPASVPLRPLLDGAVSAAGLDGSSDLVLHVGEGIDTVVVEAVALRRVLTNLLENARVHGGAPVHLGVALHVRPRAMVVTVADAGRGIPATVAGRYFPRDGIVAGPPPATGAAGTGGEGLAPGNGLGLWIVRQLVSSMGGRLDLLPPVPGQATRIRLRLPGS